MPHPPQSQPDGTQPFVERRYRHLLLSDEERNEHYAKIHKMRKSRADNSERLSYLERAFGPPRCTYCHATRGDTVFIPLVFATKPSWACKKCFTEYVLMR